MKSETIAQKKSRSAKIFEILKNTYPDAHCELKHKNIFELFVAVPLSAQTTDVAVNKITEKLFQEIKSPEDLVNIPTAKLENIIRPLGFFRQKAKNLKSGAEILIKQYHGEVPSDMNDLIKLPGIARKSANIILSVGFNINEGIAVDTHVKRVSNLIGLTDKKDPNKIEKDLCAIFPKKNWGAINHLFIRLGREICIANRPKCKECPVQNYCDFGKSIKLI